MLLADIERRAKQVLPLLTDYFSEKTAVVTGQVASNTDGVMTLSFTGVFAKWVQAQSSVQLVATEIDNVVDVVTILASTVVKLTTADDHDLSPDVHTKVKMQVDTDVNTTQDLLIKTVVSRTEVEVYVEDAATFAAQVEAATGETVIKEQNLLSPLEVYTLQASTPTTLTVTTKARPIAVGRKITSFISLGSRIYSAASIGLFTDSYTQRVLPEIKDSTYNKPKLTLACVMQPARLDKNRDTLSDARNDQGANIFNQVTFLQGWVMYVFAPSQTSNLGEVQENQMYGDVFSALHQCFVGWDYPLGHIKGAQLISTPVMVEHGYLASNDAYLIHAFTFEALYTITACGTAQELTLELGETLANRGVRFNYLNNLGEVAMTSSLDLS